MKYLMIILLAGAMLAITSCNKKKDSTKPTTPTTPSTGLNATETKLLGTWYLKKERDSMYTSSSHPAYHDTIFTGYDNSVYFKFMSDAAGDTYYKSADACVLNTNVCVPPATLNNSGANNGVLWYYDESTSFLMINHVQMIIKSLTTSELILHCKHSSNNKYYHFSK